MLTRGAVVAHALGTIMEMRLHAGDVWLHVAPMFHLVDAFAIFGMTRVAGRHVISPSFNAADCLRLIEQECVTASNGALLCTGWNLGAYSSLLHPFQSRRPCS
jgi:non-ribosomal peptide synthetase component E (peptide arylation enzyme)